VSGRNASLTVIRPTLEFDFNSLSDFSIPEDEYVTLFVSSEPFCPVVETGLSYKRSDEAKAELDEVVLDTSGALVFNFLAMEESK